MQVLLRDTCVWGKTDCFKTSEQNSQDNDRRFSLVIAKYSAAEDICVAGED